MKVLVTGAQGQLGRCINDIVQNIYGTGCLDNEFLFSTHSEFNLLDYSSMERYYYLHDGFDVVINCAAYTNVERAEDDEYWAYKTNSLGVKNLVDFCQKYDITLIHISTDYVYDSGFCKEDSKLNPLSIYAKSKRDGEIVIERSNLNKWYIFRTSWLFSEYDGNFVTNILKRIDNFNEVFGVTDECGCPTYARDLASFLVNFTEDTLNFNPINNGIYNISNIGFTTRFNFIEEIIHGYMNLDVFKNKFKKDFYPSISQEFYSKLLTVTPISQEEAYKKFNLKAPRPKNVILESTKLQEELFKNDDVILGDSMIFGIPLRRWEKALGECLERYNYNKLNIK